MDEEKKIYICTLPGGCHFRSDNENCQLAGTACSYKKEAAEIKEEKKEKWFDKYYK